jgi:hypothetical protein
LELELPTQRIDLDFILRIINILFFGCKKVLLKYQPPNKNEVKQEAGLLFTSIGVMRYEQLEKLNSFIKKIKLILAEFEILILGEISANL